MAVCNTGLSEVVRVLGALAKGDLTETITNEYAGMFGRLKDDSNQTVSSLTRTVAGIKESAEVVSTSARQISAGNIDLSQRTEEQAASLEETAASMEQLTATVHQNSENARMANDLAIGASKVALKGGQVVGEVVETMNAINDSGRKIVDIISVIDGIAFQTNILALNAAVEAARAGEQGRGFAVVAGEVRTLAQRTAAAAKEVKQLIGDSVEKTTAGTQLVGRAGETMAEIVQAVKSVTDIMSAIASASLQQGSGIGQVNEAVAQMDKVTQQNAALVEEIAASAKALEDHALGLVESVAVFTLDERLTPRAAQRTPTVERPTAAPARRPGRSASAVATGRQAPTSTVATMIQNDDPGEWKSF
jgi:methyl-accepting chemotaxis protein